MNLPASMTANRPTQTFFMSSYLAFHQKVIHTFRVGLPASNNLIKIIPHKCAPATCVFIDSKCSKKKRQPRFLNTPPNFSLGAIPSGYFQGNSYLSGGEGNGVGLTSAVDCGFYVRM